MKTYWHKQTDKPLFPDLLWDKPENKSLAGKLLIIGGNSHEFSAPGEAYQSAAHAGVGVAKVLLPEALRKTIGTVLENTEYAPSNKSGGFARTALSEWLSFAEWSDGVLITGDLGRNSETAIVLESFLEKYSGQVTLTKDAVDYFLDNPGPLFERKQTTLVVSFAQLQKMASKYGLVFKFSMTLLQIADALHGLSGDIDANIIVEHNGVVLVAVKQQVSSTRIEQEDTWRVSTAAKASVWWLQNPNKPFEALTTALVE